MIEKPPRKTELPADAKTTDYSRYIPLISNIRQDGKLIGSLPDGEVHFHPDACFSEKPPSGTFLYALEAPLAAPRGGAELRSPSQ